jgi:hypothetical protein
MREMVARLYLNLAARAYRDTLVVQAITIVARSIGVRFFRYPRIVRTFGDNSIPKARILAQN